MNEKNKAILGFAKLGLVIRQLFCGIVSVVCAVCAYETSTYALYFFSFFAFVALFLPADFYIGQRPDETAEEAKLRMRGYRIMF